MGLFRPEATVCDDGRAFSLAWQRTSGEHPGTPWVAQEQNCPSVSKWIHRLSYWGLYSPPAPEIPTDTSGVLRALWFHQAS